MRNIWLVVKHDVLVTFKERSFWLMTFLMPALLLAFNAYYIIEDSGLDVAGGEEAGSESQQIEMPTIGLVDGAGVLDEWPPGIPADLFVPFADEASARAALEAGEVDQYIHIPSDYVQTGEITVYAQDFQIMRGAANQGVTFDGANEGLLQYLLAYGLSGDEATARALQNPTPGNLATYHALAPSDSLDAESEALADLVSSIVPYIFYFLLLIGSSYLMRSVVAEKENRTAEVLLLSLDPRELMVGKIIAMSVVVLVQLAVWMGGGVLILNRGATLFNVAEFSFPPGFFVWAVLFLMGGFLLYAALMAAAGAISANAREAGQMTFLLIIPLMPTLMFGRMFFEEPNHPLVLGMSLFPFSAPSAMVTRLAVAPVPLWQTLVSLAGVALTAYVFVALSARFFRASHLLSDAAFSWQRLLTGWRS